MIPETIHQRSMPWGGSKILSPLRNEQTLALGHKLSIYLLGRNSCVYELRYAQNIFNSNTKKKEGGTIRNNPNVIHWRMNK